VGTLIALVVAVAQFASAPLHQPIDDVERFRTLMFATPLATFITVANTKSPSSLDWTSDHCSAPFVGSSGASFDFTRACRRHDFGYRNLKKFERLSPHSWWTAEWRAAVDEQFRRDMKAHCATRAVWHRYVCYWWADLYYRVVRLFGGP
jgi:hypothetical protein